MRGTKWREPQHTPDWTDVLSMMRALEELHGVTVTLNASTGAGYGLHNYTTVSACLPQKKGEYSVLGQPVCVLSAEWPCKDHKDWYACALNLLYSLDAALNQKLWEQLNLPFTADVPGA